MSNFNKNGRMVINNSVPIVTDMTAIPAEILESLNAGDRIIKQYNNQQHAYTVTYKGVGPGEGICISYCVAGYGETVSYDRTEAGGWQYNSTDIKTYGE